MNKVIVGVLLLCCLVLPALGSNVINRTSLVYLKSVNTPLYPVAKWIINPVLPKGVPSKYWKIDKNKVLEMNKTEKAVVDGNDWTSATTAKKKQLQQASEGDVYTKMITSGQTADNLRSEIKLKLSGLDAQVDALAEGDYQGLNAIDW